MGKMNLSQNFREKSKKFNESLKTLFQETK